MEIPENKESVERDLKSSPVSQAFLDTDEEEAYACDFLERQSLEVIPKVGTRSSFQINSKRLCNRIVIPDCATWTIPELQVSQEGYAHAGFRGDIKGLLEKLVFQIEMMRPGYSMEDQPKFDAFLGKVNAIISSEGSGSRQLKHQEFTICVTDPSSLCAVDNCTSEWVEQNEFCRSWEDDVFLNIVSKKNLYTRPTGESFDTASQIATLIKNSERIVAFTGAGISVESGIPPFRLSSTSEDSIWENFDASQMTVQKFNADENVAKAWWLMKHSLFPKFNEAVPNAAHQLFGQLHGLGKLSGIITQNIDSLHQAGGVPQEKNIELHGNMRGLICSDRAEPANSIPYKDGNCKFQMSHEEAMQENCYFSSIDLPLCPECDCTLRTRTVMFGQPIIEGLMSCAYNLVACSDLLFVIGSSLVVKPASEIPAVALYKGIPLIIINLHPTQYDSHATGLVCEKAGEFLDEVSKLII